MYKVKTYTNSSTTLIKSTEVQQLLKDKEERISLLEQSIEIEKKMITKHWHAQAADLQHRFDSLKVQYDVDIEAKDTHIQEFHRRIEHISVNPKLTKFDKEAKVLNSLISQQQIVFCQKFAIIHDQCRVVGSLVDQLSYIKIYFEDIEEKIYGFLT